MCNYMDVADTTLFASLEIMPVILSAAKDLARRTERSKARAQDDRQDPLKPAHGKPSLQMSNAASTHTE